MPRLKAAVLLSLATLCAPAFGQNANPAGPGTLNYVEGQVSLGNQTLSSNSVGSTELQTGQTLQTANGKAEVLLTPGVFLRLDDNSAVRMVSPSLTDTVVSLDHGRADVEVDQLYKQNHIVIDQKGGQSQLLKGGLYEFNAGDNTMRVFDGKAAVSEGNASANGLRTVSADAEKPVTVKGGHELALTGEPNKPTSFDKKQSEDDLYNWSSLRSEYLGEANLNLASTYAGAGGINPGWFWDSGLYGYTWLPGEGSFLSPFGYGFYSPWYLYGGGPIYGRGFYGGGYGRGVYGGYRGRPVAGGYRGGVPARSVTGAAHAGGFTAGGRGFHGGAVGGGGFHGGGGGFHGGGGGGHR